MRKISFVFLNVLVYLTFAPCGLTQEILPNPVPIEQEESAEIAAEEAAQRQAMQADWTTSAARAGRVRTYRAKVIDQDGKPVAGMKIGFSSLTQRDDFFSTGIAWNSADGESLTDKQGIATFTPAPFRKLEASPRLREPEFNMRFRVPYQRTPMPLTRYYENTDSASRPPDKDGFNMVFEVYRYRGPEKLGEVNRWMDIPNDGIERAVSVISDRPDNTRVVPTTAERVGAYDFMMTIKRPEMPYWNVAPNPSDRRIQPLQELPPYVLTLTCLNGGIFFVTDPQAVEAPARGYVRTIIWTSPSPPPGGYDENYFGPGTIFWNRGTTPASFVKLRLRTKWKENRKSIEVPKPLYAGIEMRFFFNQQGGRLFERADSMGEDNEPWITDVTSTQAAALEAQPIDPVQLPPADSVQIIGP